MSASFVKREVTFQRLRRQPKNNSEGLYTPLSMDINDNNNNPMKFLFLTSKLNDSEANYKARTSRKNAKHMQTKLNKKV
jgi:hypothetical protein